MDLGLAGKVVLVTGGGSGIGAAITEGLLQEGATPVIIARSPPSNKIVEFHQVELTNAEQCRKAIEKIASDFGHIDGLVNNAGANDNVGLDRSPADFMNSVNNNLSHYFTMAHFCLPMLRKSKGSIVNVSSKTAVTGQGGTSGYCAAKGAQLALTREWAVSLLKDGIRVNAVVPAEVMTPLYDKWLSSFPDKDEKLRKIETRIPLGQRMTTAKEIADTVLFLLSDRSSHTTGQWLFVDGGYSHLDRAIT